MWVVARSNLPLWLAVPAGAVARQLMARWAVIEVAVPRSGGWVLQAASMRAAGSEGSVGMDGTAALPGPGPTAA